MHLKDIAATELIDLSPSDSTDKAIALMEEHDIHHLPVVNDGGVVGIVSDRDLLESVGWLTALERVNETDGGIFGPRFVSDIMSAPVWTLRPDDSLLDAAHLMLGERISAVALVEDDQLIGLVAESDLLQCFTAGEMLFESSQWRFWKVIDHMTAHVFSLHSHDPIIGATRLMKDKGVRHIPVMNANHLAGIVSDRDIRKACFRERLEWLFEGPPASRMRTSLSDVLTRKPISVAPDATLADAASRMVDSRIGALPVFDAGQLCGIITESDLLHAFIRAHS